MMITIDRAGADSTGLLSLLYLRLNLRVFNILRTIRRYHTSIIPYIARILQLKSFFYVGIARFMFDSSFQLKSHTRTSIIRV